MQFWRPTLHHYADGDEIWCGIDRRGSISYVVLAKLSHVPYLKFLASLILLIGKATRNALNKVV